MKPIEDDEDVLVSPAEQLIFLNLVTSSKFVRDIIGAKDSKWLQLILSFAKGQLVLASMCINRVNIIYTYLFLLHVRFILN